MIPLNAAPSWRKKRDIVLWHGCTSNDESNIRSCGVEPRRGRLDADFGRGFYTTTIERQARHWAWARFYGPSFGRKGITGNQPVVLRFVIDRHSLADLRCLSFAVGEYQNEDFWSLIQHCRSSGPTAPANDHQGPRNDDGDWYDIVCGPVAAFWQQRSAMNSADQISFHTGVAAKLLNDLIATGDRMKYRWEPVK